MRCFLLVALSVISIGIAPKLIADVITIDFEGEPDGTAASSLYQGEGVTFSSGILVVSGAFGGSLNEVDFPPLPPGQAVFLNEANITTLLFTQPILSFRGYFTYGGPLTLNFYAAGNSLLSTLTSGFQANIGTGGDAGSSPNELITSSSLADAVRVDILAPGTDFTLDDLTFTTTDATPIPEPGNGVLVSTIVALLFAACQLRSRL